ncbi:MAG: oligosaccharide flippase family protein [Peptostreptococcaceae bacterium]|nr:oligosaccharide flippase family protein [Peptostreptococcaceae bacterium]
MINIKKNIENKLGKDQTQFLNHSKNYLIGNFATQSLSFLSIPIFTRLLLPNEYGLIAIVNSITQIGTILMLLNFHGALARYYHEKDGYFSTFLGSITVFLFFYNILFISCMYYFKDSFATFFNVDSKLFFLGIINGFIGLFTTLYLSYLQTSQKSKKFAIISFVRSILTLIVAIIWVISLKQNKYLGRIYSGVLINGIMFIYSLYNIIKISIFKIDFKKIKYAINFGVPLINSLPILRTLFN